MSDDLKTKMLSLKSLERVRVQLDYTKVVFWICTYEFDLKKMQPKGFIKCVFDEAKHLICKSDLEVEENTLLFSAVFCCLTSSPFCSLGVLIQHIAYFHQFNFILFKIHGFSVFHNFWGVPSTGKKDHFQPNGNSKIQQ